MNFEDRIIEDDNGVVILLADVANSGGTVLRKTGSKIGNKKHDSSSGKFTKGKKAQNAPAEPNIDPAELERMLSAARDAAREFDSFDEGDIKEFLRGRAKDHSVVDLQQFITMVRRQRVSDLADLLDQQLRSTGSMKQGRRKVRITAPRGFLRRALTQVTPEEARILLHSLVSRGHDEDEAKKFLESKNLTDVQFSDDVEYDDEPTEMMQFVETMRAQPTAAEIAASMIEAVAAMPAPQVTVTVPEPAKRKLKVHRGKNGLILRVEEEE